MRYLVHQINGSELAITLSDSIDHPTACCVEPDYGLNTSLLVMAEVLDVVRAFARYEKRLSDMRGLPEHPVQCATERASRNATEMLAHDMRDGIIRKLRSRWPSLAGLAPSLSLHPITSS